MTSPLTILHNPRCSKSRQTLALIEASGEPVVVVDYQATPPSVAELDAILSALGEPPQAIVRFKDALATELGVAADDALSREQWLALLAANPKLIERPIVVRGDKAVIGRPPENVQALINKG